MWPGRGSPFSLVIWLVFAGAGGSDCRAAVAKRDPYIRIALRLTLDEAVSSLGPGHDVFVLVVEDELALIGLYRQHRVASALLVAHHCDQQRLARPAGVNQHLALQQPVAFAVSFALLLLPPFLHHSPLIQTAH